MPLSPYEDSGVGRDRILRWPDWATCVPWAVCGAGDRGGRGQYIWQYIQSTQKRLFPKGKQRAFKREEDRESGVCRQKAVTAPAS